MEIDRYMPIPATIRIMTTTTAMIALFERPLFPGGGCIDGDGMLPMLLPEDPLADAFTTEKLFQFILIYLSLCL